MADRIYPRGTIKCLRCGGRSSGAKDIVDHKCPTCGALAEGEYEIAATTWIRFSHNGKKCREPVKQPWGAKGITVARRMLDGRMKQIGGGEFAVGQDRIWFEDERMRKWFDDDTIAATMPRDPAKAQPWLESLKTAAAEAKPSLAQMAIQDYLAHGKRSIGNLVIEIRQLRKEFGRLRATAIDRDTWKRYRARLQLEGFEIATINQHGTYLRLLLNHAKDEGKLSSVPKIELLEGANKRNDHIRAGDFFDALLPAIRAEDEDVADLVEFLYYNGWRVNAGRNLAWTEIGEDTHNGKRFFGVKQIVGLAKNKTATIVPFVGDGMMALMERRLAKRRPDCPLVFHRDGRPIKSFQKLWERVRVAIGRPDLLVHGLCRSAIKNFRRYGVRDLEGMRIANRKTQEIYNLYGDPDTKDLIESMERLDAALAAEAKTRTVVPLRRVANGEG